MIGNGSPLIHELETSEMHAWSAFYQAASRTTVKHCGLRMAATPDGLATIAANIDVLALNRVVGFGLEQGDAVNSIAQLIELYANVHAQRFFVQLSPGGRSSALGRALEAHGFRHHNNWVKLFRDASPPPPVTTGLEIREVATNEATVFGTIVARCFGWPDETIAWIGALVGQPGWHHYFACDGDAPVGTAALFAQRGSAWLDFASTLPAYRGHGVQSALLARRIRHAAELGCRRLVVETAEQTPERGAPSYRNTRRFGFQAAYVRPNYLYEVEARA